VTVDGDLLDGNSFDGDIWAGVRDVSPLLLGIVPFGLVAGIAAVNAGLGLAEAVGMSVIVFAGASQLAAIELIGSNAPLAVVVGTAVVINVRMVMYSASIAPHFADYGRRLRAGLAYVLTDQAYALSVAEFERNPERSRCDTTSARPRRCGSSGRSRRWSASSSALASPTRGG